MTIEVTAPRPTEEEILAYRLQQERADQELAIYNRLLEEANEREMSFAGHLNSLDAAGLLEGPAGNRYDLFMKKYEQDMDYQKLFGDQLQKERRMGKTKNDEDMDPFLLEELIKQRQILNEIDKKHRRGISSGEYTRLANGGSPEQELVNQRIAELMMEEPVNEMRAVSPDMFERQKLGIERLLSNLYEPRRARDIAEAISTGIEFTPLGDPAALAEGFKMMGDDQPLMGAALMAGSVFSTLPANTIKTWLKTVRDKLDTDVAASIYDAENFIRQPSRGDRFQGRRMLERARAKEKELLNLEKELQDALENPELPLSELDDPIKSLQGRPTMNEVLEGVKTPEQILATKPMLSNLRRNSVPVSKDLPKQAKGIVSATPDINRLFREISESPSRINTPQHQAAAKYTSEQLRKINQGIEKLEPTERDRVAELIQKLLEDR